MIPRASIFTPRLLVPLALHASALFTGSTPAGDSYAFFQPGDNISSLGAFSRTSTAYQQTASGTLQLVAANTPRDSHYTYDSSSGTYVRTLLMEDAGANRHLNSETFTVYNATAGTITKTAAFGIAPDGTQTTTRIQGDTATRVFRYSSGNNGIGAVSTQYCVSFFYRGTGKSVVSISARTGGTVPVTYLPAPAGAMQRCYAVITSGTFATAILDLTVLANSDFEIWGIQVEQGVSFPSSYMRSGATMGTRAADVLAIAPKGSCRYKRYYLPTSAVETETVVAAADYTANLPVGRAYLNIATAGSVKTGAEFHQTLGLNAPNLSAPPGLQMFRRLGNATRTICGIGDSTLANANFFFQRLAVSTVTGGKLEGVTILNHGNGGASLDALLTDFPGLAFPFSTSLAVNADLYIVCYLINDTRGGAATLATCISRLQQAIDRIRAARPNADILLMMPNSLLSNDPNNTGYVTTTGLYTGMTLAQAAQTATDIMRAAYLHFDGLYPYVHVFDSMAEIFGTTCTTLALNPKMADPLHPGQAGQEERADKIRVLTAP